MANDRTPIPALEAVRRFSEMLNNVKYRRKTYLIMESGRPIALLRPPDEGKTGHTLAELPEIFSALPSLGDDAENFKCDLEISRHRWIS